MKRIKIITIGMFMLVILCGSIVLRDVLSAKTKTTTSAYNEQSVSEATNEYIDAQTVQVSDCSVLSTTTLNITITAKTRQNTKLECTQSNDSIAKYHTDKPTENTTITKPLTSTILSTVPETYRNSTEIKLTSTSTNTTSSDDICEKYRPTDTVEELDKGVWLRKNGKVVVFVEEGYISTYTNVTSYNERIEAAQNYKCEYCGKPDCKSIKRTYSYGGVLIKAYSEYPQYCPAVNPDGTTNKICEFCGKPLMLNDYYVQAGCPPDYCNGTCNWIIY